MFDYMYIQIQYILRIMHMILGWFGGGGFYPYHLGLFMLYDYPSDREATLKNMGKCITSIHVNW